MESNKANKIPAPQEPPVEQDRQDPQGLENAGAFRESVLPREFALGAKLRLLYCFPGAIFFAIFFAMGMLALSFAHSMIDYGLWFRAAEWGAGTTANLTSIAETRTSEGDNPVMAYHYTFTAPDGRKYEGVSYSTELIKDQAKPLPLRFDPDDPSDSILTGMRRKQFPPVLFMIGLFPVVGGLGLYFTHRSRRRLAYLLRYSPRYRAEVLRIEASNIKVNNRTHRVTYVYLDDLGLRREYDAGLSVMPNTHRYYTLLLPPEGGKGVILEHHRAKVEIDERGMISCRGMLFALLWIPIAIAGVVGAFLLPNFL